MEQKSWIDDAEGGGGGGSLHGYSGCGAGGGAGIRWRSMAIDRRRKPREPLRPCHRPGRHGVCGGPRRQPADPGVRPAGEGRETRDEGREAGDTSVVGAAPPLVHSTSQLYLGNAHNFNKFGHAFPGKIDEVRISNVARSAEWLRTTYDMIKGNAAFATYSSAKENVRGTILYFR